MQLTCPENSDGGMGPTASFWGSFSFHPAETCKGGPAGLCSGAGIQLAIEWDFPARPSIHGHSAWNWMGKTSSQLPFFIFLDTGDPFLWMNLRLRMNTKTGKIPVSIFNLFNIFHSLLSYEVDPTQRKRDYAVAC